MVERYGRLRADGRRFALVVSRTNEFVTRQLLQGARDCLRQHGAGEDMIDIYWVPGAWELPPVVSRLALASRYAAIVSLGSIIRGETPHFEFLAGAALRQLADIAASSPTYVALGVLTTDTLEQALERAGGKGGNAGWQATEAAIEMADLLGRLDEASQ